MAAIHPAAAHHLPWFITPPGQTDVLFNAMLVFLLLAVLGVGILYLKIHSLPEHVANRGEKTQYEVVAVLCLLALFTHNNFFWVAALLLAMVQLPDFSTPLGRIADALETRPRRGRRLRPVAARILIAEAPAPIATETNEKTD